MTGGVFDRPDRDHDKSVGIDGTGELTLWQEQIRDPRPMEARNPGQNRLGLASGRLVPDQQKMSLPNGRENARGCARAVETRRDELRWYRPQPRSCGPRAANNLSGGPCQV